MWGYFQLSAIKSGIQTTKSISLIPTKFQTSNSMPCSPAQILNNSKLSLFLGTVPTMPEKASMVHIDNDAKPKTSYYITTLLSKSFDGGCHAAEILWWSIECGM